MVYTLGKRRNDRMDNMTETRIPAHDPMIGYLQRAYAAWGSRELDNLWGIAKCHEEIDRFTELVHTVVSKDLTLGVTYTGHGDSPGALPYAEINLNFWVPNETDPTHPAYVERRLRISFGLSEIYDDKGYVPHDQYGNETQIYVQLWDEDKGDSGQGDFIDGDYVRYEHWATASPTRILAHLHHYRDAAQALAQRTSELGTSR